MGGPTKNMAIVIALLAAIPCQENALDPLVRF